MEHKLKELATNFENFKNMMKSTQVTFCPINYFIDFVENFLNEIKCEEECKNNKRIEKIASIINDFPVEEYIKNLEAVWKCLENRTGNVKFKVKSRDNNISIQTVRTTFITRLVQWKVLLEAIKKECQGCEEENAILKAITKLDGVINMTAKFLEPKITKRRSWFSKVSRKMRF